MGFLWPNVDYRGKIAQYMTWQKPNYSEPMFKYRFRMPKQLFRDTNIKLVVNDIDYITWMQVVEIESIHYKDYLLLWGYYATELQLMP